MEKKNTKGKEDTKPRREKGTNLMKISHEEGDIPICNEKYEEKCNNVDKF
jgi:hypothetical protein